MPVVFDVEGMTCASCVARVERILDRQDGVETAIVNLATEQARVSTAPGVDTQSLIDSVAKAGYTMTVRSEHDPKDMAEHHHGNQADALRRFVSAAALAIPVIVLAMAGFEAQWSRWAQAVLSAPVVFWAGAPFHTVAWARLKVLTSNMDTLISLGTLTAWGYSLWALFNDRAVFFETAAAIVAFLLLGRYFEAAAKGRASEAIARLIDLGAKEARAMRAGEWQNVDVSSITVGESVEVLPGAKVPLDGVVTEGTTAIDESMVTGEAVPADRGPGDAVIGGTVNHNGRIVIEATTVGEDTVLAGIVRLVEEAQATKAPIQGLADRVAAVFVPSVIVIAALTFTSWLIATQDIERSIQNAVSVLIIACPCAVGLATPTAILVGTGRGAQEGIVYRQADVFERLETVDVVAFDKTGTLTSGTMMLTDIQTDDDQFLSWIAAVEAGSGHPIGAAIVEGARQRSVMVTSAEDVSVLPGKGVVGAVEGHVVSVGTPEFMVDQDLTVDPRWTKVIAVAQAHGTTASFGGWDGAVRGVVVVSDAVRPTAGRAMTELAERGITTMMLTGDHEDTAKAVGNQVGVADVRARLLPAEKASAISDLQSQDKTVAFVGDGINDAPALATADLGMSVGTGSDIAIETGDVTLMSGDPRLVVSAIDLAARTLRGIRQNLWWAFGYNVAAIPLAVAGVLNPMIASAAMALSSVSVVLNSLRIRRWKP